MLTILDGVDLRYVNSLHLKDIECITIQMNLALDNDEIAYWVELAEITNGNFQGSLTDFKKHIETLGLSRSEFSRYQR